MSLTALPQKQLALLAIKLIRSGKMPSPGVLTDAIEAGRQAATKREVVKLSRAGEHNREGLIRATRDALHSGTSHMILADHLEDNGLPGAHIVREAGRLMNETGRTHNPMQGRGRMYSHAFISITPKPSKVWDNKTLPDADENRKYWDEKNKADAVLLAGENGEDHTWPIVQVKHTERFQLNPNVGPRGVFLTIMHRSPRREPTPEEKELGRTSPVSAKVANGVEVRSIAHLQHLLQDFPNWAKRKIVAHIKKSRIKLPATHE